MTIGTKTPDTRSARRCTSALPFCASSTSRAICASWVSAPTRVARTTSRPPALTVAPTTASPGFTSTGTDSPVSMRGVDRGAALDDLAVGGDLLAGAYDEQVARRELVDRDPGLVPVAQHRHVADAELEQRPERRARTPLGAVLEPASGEEERRHPGRGLEVDVGRAVGAVDRDPERVGHPGLAGGAEEERPQRPAERRQHADRHQRVHGGRAVAQVGPRRAVEGPRAPHDDGGSQGERGPLPVGELPGRDHRDRDDRDAEGGADEQPLQQRVALRLGGGDLVGRRRAARRRSPRPRRSASRSSVETVTGKVTFAFSVA